MASTINIGGVSTVYSGGLTDKVLPITGASGSVFTYRLYGANGATGEVRGGFAGDTWADMQVICTLVVGDANPDVNPQSAVVQHTWPVIMISGNIKVARGAA